MISIQLRRAKFLQWFANRAPCLVGMEACGGSQHWARKLQEGHAEDAKAMQEYAAPPVPVQMV